jgi:cellulose biosynthesis protein BcsQ
LYTTTFYSFKGGVGRSMALVNCAFELANRGKKVLVVDFDLEAPGMPTFDLFSGASSTLGIVDYVAAYARTGQAPAVGEYVQRCSFVQDSASRELLVMPAGRQGSEYARNLGVIDWQDLYDKQDGYLLFEDLKQQWKRDLGVDYVLIDSRTGHTDVGGICTRQLPDSVVAMFFPNQQNLVGLNEVVQGVRQENSTRKTSGRKNIVLKFVVSNAPLLDDEEGILQDRIAKFRSLLGYEKESAIIHHYDSLALMNQSVFTRDRPKSRLAKEYSELVTSIVSDNLEDPQAALAFVRSFANSLLEEGLTDAETVATRLNAVDEIIAIHQADGEILSEAAKVRQRLGDFPTVATLLTSAIESGFLRPSVLGRRALAYMSLLRPTEAVADLVALLGLDSAKFQDIYQAINRLADLEPRALRELADKSAFKRLDAASQMTIASESLLSSRELAEQAELIFRDIVRNASDPTITDKARIDLPLVLIAVGRFKEAMSMIASDRSELLKSGGIAELFNYAMAEWAETRRPPLDLLQRALELEGPIRAQNISINYHQCFALVLALLGSKEKALGRLESAMRLLDSKPRHEFSAWRYLRVSPEEMRKDLNSMKAAIVAGDIKPAFFSDDQTWFN